MKTILVVEADPSVLTLMNIVVERHGYTMLTANSAHQAFDRFEENDGHVDLLIADGTLPVFSGLRVALEFRALLPYLKIIITSPVTTWTEDHAAELEELPADSVVTLLKPIAPATLLDTIHCLIGFPCAATPALQMKVAS